jgi:hypothetical protein
MSAIANRIRIGTKLGNETMIMRFMETAGGGPVFSGMSISTKRLCQIRFFSDEEIRGAADLDRRMEAATLLREKCGEIVTLPVKHGIHEGLPYVIHDFPKVRTLEESLHVGKSFSDAEAKHLVEKIFNALAVAHEEGIFHLGLSPLSIHQRAGGFSTTEWGIIDFCLAPRKGPSYYSNPSGTDKRLASIAAYASPEQAALSDKVDHRSDLYSLGALLYTFATGSPPFQGSTPEQIFYKVIAQEPRGLTKENPAVPDGILEFMSRAVQKNPDNRFQSVAEMMESFYGSLMGRIVRTSLPPPAARASSPDLAESAKFVPPPAPAIPSLTDKLAAARPPAKAAPKAKPEHEKGPARAAPTALAKDRPLAAIVPKAYIAKPTKAGKPGGKTSAPPPPPKPKLADGIEIEAWDDFEPTKTPFPPLPARRPSIPPLAEKNGIAIPPSPAPSEKARKESDTLEAEISVDVQVDEEPEKKARPGAAVAPDHARKEMEKLFMKAVVAGKSTDETTMPPDTRRPGEIEAIIKRANIEASKKILEKSAEGEKPSRSSWAWIAFGIIFVGVVCAAGYFVLLKSKTAAHPDDETTQAAAPDGESAEGSAGVLPDAGQAGSEEASPAAGDAQSATPDAGDEEATAEAADAAEADAIEEAAPTEEEPAGPQPGKKKKKKKKKEPSPGMRFIE